MSERERISRLQALAEKGKRQAAEKKAAAEEGFLVSQFIADYFQTEVSTLGGAKFTPQSKIDIGKYGK